MLATLASLLVLRLRCLCGEASSPSGRGRSALLRRGGLSDIDMRGENVPGEGRAGRSRGLSRVGGGAGGGAKVPEGEGPVRGPRGEDAPALGEEWEKIVVILLAGEDEGRMGGPDEGVL